jgi:hypothetical protein
MARGRRITVRLADWEIQSVRRFADENHLLPSVAVRWLLNGGLGSGEPSPAAGLSDESECSSSANGLATMKSTVVKS